MANVISDVTNGEFSGDGSGLENTPRNLLKLLTSLYMECVVTEIVTSFGAGTPVVTL